MDGTSGPGSRPGRDSRACRGLVDGELPDPRVPIIPGHEIVGRIDAIGSGVGGLSIGERVGIPWLGHTCGVCAFFLGARENLCDRPQFTGYTRDGGFATVTIADARYAFLLGETGSDVAIAPLLCAGLIGWRSLVIVGDGMRIGLYGFGAAVLLVAQIARWQGRTVSVRVAMEKAATGFGRQPRAPGWARLPAPGAANGDRHANDKLPAGEGQ